MDKQKQPSKNHPLPRRSDQSRHPHVHSSHRRDVAAATSPQRRAPWTQYQLSVDDGKTAQSVKTCGEEVGSRGTKTGMLDPETRAGCVPAPAYPSFRTLAPRSAAATRPHRLPRAHLADSRTNRKPGMSYYHYVKKPASKRTTEADTDHEKRRSYPQLLRHYYHGPLSKASPRFLVDFGQHGTLLSQPLLAPSGDSRSEHTEEDKDTAAAAAISATGQGPSPSSEDSEMDEVPVESRGCRYHYVMLISLALLIVVIAAVALPIWLIPSGTGRSRIADRHTLSFDVVVSLDNRTYDTSLLNPTSLYFRQLEREFCNLMRETFGVLHQSCYVQYFSRGSVVVHSRVELLLERLEMDMRHRGGLITSQSALRYAMTVLGRRALTDDSNPLHSRRTHLCASVKSLRIVDPSKPSTVPVSFAGMMTNKTRQVVFCGKTSSPDRCSNHELKLSYCHQVTSMLSKWHQKLLRETCDVTFIPVHSVTMMSGRIHLVHEKLIESARAARLPGTNSGFIRLLHDVVRNYSRSEVLKATSFHVINVGDVEHDNDTILAPAQAIKLGCRSSGVDVGLWTPVRRLSTSPDRLVTGSTRRASTSSSESSFQASASVVPDRRSTAASATTVSHRSAGRRPAVSTTLSTIATTTTNSFSGRNVTTGNTARRFTPPLSSRSRTTPVENTAAAMTPSRTRSSMTSDQGAVAHHVDDDDDHVDLETDDEDSEPQYVPNVAPVLDGDLTTDDEEERSGDDNFDDDDEGTINGQAGPHILDERHLSSQPTTGDGIYSVTTGGSSNMTSWKKGLDCGHLVADCVSSDVTSSAVSPVAGGQTSAASPDTTTDSYSMTGLETTSTDRQTDDKEDTISTSGKTFTSSGPTSGVSPVTYRRSTVATPSTYWSDATETKTQKTWSSGDATAEMTAEDRSRSTENMLSTKEEESTTSSDDLSTLEMSTTMEDTDYYDYDTSTRDYFTVIIGGETSSASTDVIQTTESSEPTTTTSASTSSAPDTDETENIEETTVGEVTTAVVTSDHLESTRPRPTTRLPRTVNLLLTDEPSDGTTAATTTATTTTPTTTLRPTTTEHKTSTGKTTATTTAGKTTERTTERTTSSPPTTTADRTSTWIMTTTSTTEITTRSTTGPTTTGHRTSPSTKTNAATTTKPTTRTTTTRRATTTEDKTSTWKTTARTTAETTTEATTTSRLTSVSTPTETSLDSSTATTVTTTPASTTTTTTSRPISIVTPGAGILFSIATPAVRSRSTVKPKCPSQKTTSTTDSDPRVTLTSGDSHSLCQCNCDDKN